MTITATLTGINTVLKTNTDGIYSAIDLPIGKYNVTVEHPGFKKYTQAGITLNSTA